MSRKFHQLFKRGEFSSLNLYVNLKINQGLWKWLFLVWGNYCISKWKRNKICKLKFSINKNWDPQFIALIN